MPGMSDSEDQARSPSSAPAPNTMGIIPSLAQALVRCSAVLWITERAEERYRVLHQSENQQTLSIPSGSSVAYDTFFEEFVIGSASVFEFTLR